MGSPALTLEASATLVMAMAAQLRVMDADAELSPSVPAASLLEEAEAVLFTVPHVALVVGEVMWTWMESPEARSAGPYTTWPLAMENPALDPPASMDQDRPALVGRASSTVTPWAVPAPLLATVTT